MVSLLIYSVDNEYGQCRWDCCSAESGGRCNWTHSSVGILDFGNSRGMYCSHSLEAQHFQEYPKTIQRYLIDVSKSHTLDNILRGIYTTLN